MGDVMIRGELNELYWLNKEVEDLQNRLQELEETNGVGSSKMGDGIHSNEIRNPVEKVAMKKMQVKTRIAETMLIILEEKERIERFVETIPDSQIRTIIRLRNIDLMSWEAIGSFMGLDRKTVSSKYNKFLKELEKGKEDGRKDQRRIDSDNKRKE